MSNDTYDDIDDVIDLDDDSETNIIEDVDSLDLEFIEDGSSSLEPDTSPGMVPPTSDGSGFRGLNDSNQSSGAGPRPASGANPRPMSGANPRPTSGVNPRPTSGANPRPASGANPRPMSGANPRPASGANPRPASGANPRAPSGAMRPASGVNPRAPSGAMRSPSGALQAPNLNRPGSGPHRPAPGSADQLEKLTRSVSGRFAAVVEPDSGSQPAVEPLPMKKLIIRGILAALVIGVVAGCAVGYFAVVRWLTPNQLLLWAAIGVGFPATVVGLIATWPGEDRVTVGTLLAGLIPGLLVAVLGVASATVWHSADLRMQALQYAPDDIELLTRVWHEKNLKISVAACKRMIAHHEPKWRRSLVANMTLRPATAPECVKSMKAGPTQEKVVAAVIDRWEKDLLGPHEKPNDRRLCQLAQSMTELPTSTEENDARLLTCTLTAETENAQTCCSKILAANVADHKEMIKRVSESLQLVSGQRAAGSLMSMAFHRQNLTKPQAELAQMMKFDSRDAQTATLELACHDLTDNDDADIVPHFAASLGRNCRVDAAELPQSRDPWTPICDTVTKTLKNDPIIAPSEALCDAAHSYFMKDAVQTASDFVMHAVRSNQASGMGRNIDLGYERRMQNNMSPEQMNAKMQDTMALIQGGMTPQAAAARAGMNLSAYSKFRPAHPARPVDGQKALRQIFGKMNMGDLSSVAKSMGKDSSAVKEAVKQAAQDVASQNSEGKAPPGKKR